jgi:AmmeMemoRadiSam system protein A
MDEEAAAPDLADDERRALLKLARKSLTHWLKTKESLPEAEQEACAVGETSRMGLNCFVSLHDRGQLRGCIGTLASDKPLFRSVASMAISAGARDPRFPAVSAEELERCDFEVSALGFLRHVESLEEIHVNRHGLLIEAGPKRGILLPQVARKHGWSARELLRQTHIKAGLEPSEDLEGKDVFVFSACVFGENDYSDLAR